MVQMLLENKRDKAQEPTWELNDAPQQSGGVTPEPVQASGLARPMATGMGLSDSFQPGTPEALTGCYHLHL